MTQRQQENVAKYFYDLSKIVFATAVIGNFIAWKNFDMVTLCFGASNAWLLFWWGYVLDGRKS